MISRVTTSMMTSIFISDIQKSLKEVTKLQSQVSTGKKVEYPSDDPVGASRILDYDQALSQTDQYTETIDAANSLATNTDGVLDHMETLLLRVRDLAVEASNEAVNNQESMDAIASEIDSLIADLVTQANQKYNGTYLFSGNKTTTTPFVAKDYVEFTYGQTNVATNGAVTLNMPSYTIDGVTNVSQAITSTDSVTDIVIIDTSGNRRSIAASNYTVDPATNTISITDVGTDTTGTIGIASTDTIEVHFNKTVSVVYNGDMGTKEMEISEGTKVAVSYIGATADQAKNMSVFGSYSSDGTETASVEAFQKLMDLRDNIYKYTNVGESNIDAITSGIDDVDSIRENITTIRSEQGGRANRLELATNRLSSLKINITDLKSSIEDVDMAEAISDLVLQQNTYQSALAAGSRIITTTLLDYLS